MAHDSLVLTWSLQGSTFCANSRLASVCSWPQNTFWRKDALGVHSVPQAEMGWCSPRPPSTCHTPTPAHPISRADELSLWTPAQGKCKVCMWVVSGGTGRSLSRGAGCPGSWPGSGTSAELSSPGAGHSLPRSARPLGRRAGQERWGVVRGRWGWGAPAAEPENTAGGSGHSSSHRK